LTGFELGSGKSLSRLRRSAHGSAILTEEAAVRGTSSCRQTEVSYCGTKLCLYYVSWLLLLLFFVVVFYLGILPSKWRLSSAVIVSALVLKTIRSGWWESY